MKIDIDLIIFDFDGVIINSGADIAAAVQYALEYFSRPCLPKEEIIAYVGLGVEHLIRKSFKGCSDDIIGRAMPVYRDYYLRHSLVETALYPNVKETLELFKSKRLALVTNKPEDISYSILKGLGISGYFDMIVGPESVNRMKPDPEGLLKVAGKLEKPVKRSIMVGDSHTDIEAGKSAGMHTCGVTYGLGDVAMLKSSRPDFIIDDMIKLKDIIQ